MPFLPDQLDAARERQQDLSRRTGLNSNLPPTGRDSALDNYGLGASAVEHRLRLERKETNAAANEALYGDDL